MAQCKRILGEGEQCSNRAVPGTDYCESHRKIRFTRVEPGDGAVTGPPDVPAPVPVAPVPGAPKPSAAVHWTAVPSAAGAPPAFPGLRADARGILVGPECVIWIPEAAEDQPGSLFDRVVRLAAFLSQETPLPGHLRLRWAGSGAGALVSLAPEAPERPDLSRLYDSAAAAAAFSSGELYVGQGRLFVRYRDSDAPRGYDAEDVRPPRGDALYLVGPEGTRSLSPRTLEEESLDRFLLRVAVVPHATAERPERAFALAAAPLYRMLARYFRDHQLGFRVGRLQEPDGEELILFEVTPRREAPTGLHVPGFVLSYLQGLPRCSVLEEAWSGGGRRMLVEWRRRSPFTPAHVAEAFPADALLILAGGDSPRNLCVSPAPSLFEGDELTSPHAPALPRATLTPASEEAGRLTLPLRLVHDPGPTPDTAALLLNARELAWLRRLLYRLPGEAFGRYSLCTGTDDRGEERAVLLADGMAVESVPFGIPLRRVEGAHLFIPLRARFTPALSWPLLAQALELDERVLTFLTRDLRLDVPRTAFAPLSRVLVAEPGRPRVSLTLAAAPELPPLEWMPPPPDEPAAPAKPAGGLSRLFRGRQPERSEDPPRGRQPGGGASGTGASAGRAGEAAVEALLRERAWHCQKSGDHLAAALYFELGGDEANAARCYHEAARQLHAAHP